MRVEVPPWLAPVVFWGQRIGTTFTRNRASLAAGGLAYFVTLSLAPLAIAFGALAGLVLDPRQVKAALESIASRSPDSAFGAGGDIADALMSLVTGASTGAASATTIVGFVVALYASSKVVYGLRMAMNTAFDVQERRSGTVERLFSAVVTLVGLIAAVALVILVTVVPRILRDLGLESTSLTTGNSVLDWVILTLVVYGAVWSVISFAPNRRRRVSWRAWGVLAATACVVGATVFVGIYVRLSSTMSAAVVALGTPVVLLLWLYLCFLGLLVGAAIVADSEQRQEARLPDA